MRGSMVQSTRKRKSAGDSLNVNQEAIAREMHGHVIVATTALLPDYQIEQFFDEKRRSAYHGKLRYITVYVDPAGYGQCLCGFTAVATIDDKQIVLAVDARNVPQDLEYNDFVMANLFKLSQAHRVDPFVTPILVAYESNGQDRGAYNFQTKIGQQTHSHFANIVMLGDPRNAIKVGVYLSRDRTAGMVDRIRELLGDNMISIHRELCTMHPDGAEAPMQELRDEMFRFRVPERGDSLTFDSNGEKRRKRPRFTGKEGGHNDDAIVSLMGTLWWHREVRRNVYYADLVKHWHLEMGGVYTEGK